MDPLLIEQALLNLLQNAALHATNATYVKISVEREQKQVRLRVLDDGCGIKPEMINRFRFGREGKRDLYGDSSRSTGIGLSVCSAIVTAHNGTLRLANSENGGFCATILLPLED